jgi:hypothetical protein
MGLILFVIIIILLNRFNFNNSNRGTTTGPEWYYTANHRSQGKADDGRIGNGRFSMMMVSSGGQKVGTRRLGQVIEGGIID